MIAPSFCHLPDHGLNRFLEVSEACHWEFQSWAAACSQRAWGNHCWNACFLSIARSLILLTSSTAQGGGGSFRNGKPIGEVSWCDAKMAERTHWWIERWLSVSPFLSLFLSFSLCLSFAIYLQSYLSSHLPIYLSIHVSIDRFVYSPIY